MDRMNVFDEKRVRHTSLVMLLYCAIAVAVQFIPYSHSISIAFQVLVVGSIILWCGTTAEGLIPLLTFCVACSYINVSVTSDFETYYGLNSTMVLMYLVAIIALGYVKNRKLVIRKDLIPLLAFSLLVLLSRYFAKSTAEYTENFIAVFLMYLVVTSMINTENDVYASKLAFVLSGCFTSAFILIHIFQHGTLYEFGVRVDRNYQSAFLLICIVESFIFILKYWHRTNFLGRVMSVCSIVGSAAVILTSASRAGLLAIAIAALMYILVNMRKARKVFVFIVIAAILIIFAYHLHLFDYVLERFTYSTVQGGHGRDILWENYLNGFLNGNVFQFVFGHGLIGISQFGNVAHNTFVSILYSFGLLGFSLFSFIICRIICSVIKTNHLEELVAIIPVIFINCTIDQYYRYEFALWLAVTLGTSIVYRKGEKYDV